MPGRTCLASIKSKGGKSKSFNRGLLSASAICGPLDKAETEKDRMDGVEARIELLLIALRRWGGEARERRRQMEKEEDQRGQIRDLREEWG